MKTERTFVQPMSTVYLACKKFYTHPAPVPAVPELVPEWMKDKLITIYNVVEDNDEYCQYIWYACRAAMLNYSGDAKIALIDKK
ncbi:MAG: hypothetical protein E7L09_13045 [Enterobacteriaceae bacterium]|jgi:hypothetical protein|nr:hypothetical protein [Enterobacteriaceae bacterium]MDU7379285.1 hypothetical protein [Enterobacteriaceae bacterium]